MKNRLKAILVLAGLLVCVPRPAHAKCHWYDIICGISNEVDCGHWGSCNNNPPPPAPPPSPVMMRQAPPPANSGSTTQTNPPSNSLLSASGPGPNVNNPAQVVIPKNVAPPPGAAAANASNGPGSVALAQGSGASAAAPVQKVVGGGGAPTPSGFGPNTIDAPDVGHSLAALNNLTAADARKLASAGLDYSGAGAQKALIQNPQAASMLGEGQAGAKPSLEMNIYKTVGAIPGVDKTRSGQELQAQLAQALQNKLAMKDWDGVADAASAIIKADPTNIIAYVRRAEAFNHLGRYADAERDALEAVRRDPANEQAWKELAWAQLRQGKFKEALETISKAIGLSPKDAEAYAMRAFIREAMGDLKGRLEDIAMAAMLDRRFQPAYERAKAGEMIYQPEEEEDVLLGLARPKRHEEPLSGTGVLSILILALLAGGVVLASRKLFFRKAAVSGGERPQTPSGQPSASGAAPRAEAPAVRKISTGDIIGKYQLGRVVGRGGMGQVFEAVDLSLARPVAVKKMTDQVAKLGPQGRALFLKEARTVAQLHHPAIVEIYEILEEGDDLFMVFELLKGKTAQQLLAEAGKLPLPKVVELLKPVCEALDFAHARALVHRDLKPGNIMITEEGHVKLMDFGLARSVGDTAPVPAGTSANAPGFARTSIVAGTVEYRAPEAENGIVCKEGDVYSLGVTAYELLTGRLPYSPLSSAADKTAQRFARASALAPGLAGGVDDAVAKALQAAPESRTKTPGEFLSALAAA